MKLFQFINGVLSSQFGWSFRLQRKWLTLAVHKSSDHFFGEREKNKWRFWSYQSVNLYFITMLLFVYVLFCGTNMRCFYPFESHRVTQLVCAYPITNIFFSAFFCSFLLIKLYQDFLWATSSFLIIFLLNNTWQVTCHGP